MPADRLLFVTGTGTEVGKTWVAAALTRRMLDDGLTVAVRKPVQSFEPGDEGATDADILAAASGEQAVDVCPTGHWLPAPMAPPMAATRLGRRCPSLEDLVTASSILDLRDVAIVEGVGGLLSPTASDGDNRDLIRRLSPDMVLVVATAGLGVLHDVRATSELLAGHDVVVMLNRFDAANALHRENRDWLIDAGIEAVTDMEALRRRCRSASDSP